MKVILIRDYEKLGSVGDIVNVKDGFAKNYLFPNNIAQKVTAGNIRQVEIVKKSLIKKEAKNIDEASKIAEIIDGLHIKFMVNAGPEGKLYGSITSKDIAEKILEEKKVDIDRKKIELEEHIKEVGLYDIVIKLYKDVRAVIKVEVASEDFIADTESKIDTPKEENNKSYNNEEDVEMLAEGIKSDQKEVKDKGLLEITEKTLKDLENKA